MTLNVKVFRFNPETDKVPRFDTFKIEEFPNMAVLDVVMNIQNYHDPTLAYRCSCRIGMCGSCAMYINGRPRLACRTQVSSLGTKDITIMPLPNLPIIRDLAVDMEPFFEKYKKIKPYLIPKQDLKEPVICKPDSGERELIDYMLECITCGACYGACTMVATDPHYLGPAALTRAYCLIADKRDAATRERLVIVEQSEGVWRCHTQFNCAEVCPKKIVPTQAIQQLKKRCVFKRLGLFRG
ncbi:succinate dehydrogenase/fumarate reductase iron-sulfur subunit [Desulfofundulus luciae]|uniref:succinate dehydrogenase/fumarate reductase iron-sulfur subunit n=1 Tax=Desulfofundulus luciae TaxID=74702 RepID=UPI0027D7FA1F|nr:succinate dehydrogenase iron-sulfur subunit [Desulfofundulus luciae]